MFLGKSWMPATTGILYLRATKRTIRESGDKHCRCIISGFIVFIIWIIFSGNGRDIEMGHFEIADGRKYIFCVVFFITLGEQDIILTSIPLSSKILQRFRLAMLEPVIEK